MDVDVDVGERREIEIERVETEFPLNNAANEFN